MTPAAVTKVTITIASADAMERGRGARVLSFETAMTAKETHNALSVVATLLRYYTTRNPQRTPNMAEDSTFNAEQFIGAQSDQAGETKFYPVPVGEYLAQIDKIEARGGIDKNGNPWRALDVLWHILDDGVKAELQTEKPLARQNIFVNVTPQGGLDWGRNKNIALGRLREAVGQNRPGRPWSPTHLQGQMAKVSVIHEPDQNGDPRATVNKVASA